MGRVKTEISLNGIPYTVERQGTKILSHKEDPLGDEPSSVDIFSCEKDFDFYMNNN